MSATTTFTVPNLEGVTFIAQYDPEQSWMNIDGTNAAGVLVFASGFAISPEPIDPVAVTPEPVVMDEQTE